MRKLLIAASVFLCGAAMAEDRYALADFESVGMAVRGEHPEMIGGGNFALDEDGSVKPFTREECEKEARARGGRNGLYVDRDTSALGRRACFRLDVTKKYLRDTPFWNIDLDLFLKDNGARFPERLRPSQADKYSIFPLD